MSSSVLVKSVLSLARWSAGAGRRQPEAFPSGRHHEPDPQETLGRRQEAAGSLPVLGLGADGDPRGRRVGGEAELRCGATCWLSPLQ